MVKSGEALKQRFNSDVLALQLTSMPLSTISLHFQLSLGHWSQTTSALLLAGSKRTGSRDGSRTGSDASLPTPAKVASWALGVTI